MKYLLKRARKNKSPFGISLQKHRGVLEGSIRNSSSTKDMGNRGKKYSTEITTQQLVEALDSKVKINTKETFDMLFPPIIPIEDLSNVHPWVKSLFSARIVTNLPLAGRLTFFGSMGDTYKGSRNFRNSKGIQNTFSKKSNTEESSPETPHMGQEQADLQYKWR